MSALANITANNSLCTHLLPMDTLITLTFTCKYCIEFAPEYMFTTDHNFCINSKTGRIIKQALNNYIKGRNAFNDVVRLGLLKYFDLPEKIFTQHEIHLTLKGNRLIVL